MAANTLKRATFALLAFSRVRLGDAASNCPLYGPEFPPPLRMTEHPYWQDALANLTKAFDKLDHSNVTGIDTFSYSYQAFSASEGVIWERYFTAVNLPANTTGVKKVDGDTVYRLGSVTKILTMLTWLSEVGDTDWNTPITKFIPELGEASAKQRANFDNIKNTAWEDITIGSLASHLSGLGRDYGAQGEILETFSITDPQKLGFPVLPDDEHPPCGTYPICTKQQVITGLTDIMYPSYAPYTTTVYSNIAYQLLGYALENITGKKFEDMLNSNVINALNLNRTYYNTPPDSVGIIPGSYDDTYWNVPLGDAGPTGNAYSSANDVTEIGRAILNHKLIKPVITKRWLQPAAFVADIVGSVGAPWGVRRMEIQGAAQPKRTTTAYTKAGGFKIYNAMLSVLPDYDLGFSVLMAGPFIYPHFNVADLAGSIIIPAYNYIVRDQARKTYGGTYIATGYKANDTSTFSYINIGIDPAKPGMGINYWYEEGVDMLTLAYMFSTGVKPKKAEAHLQWTQLESNNTIGGKDQAWKAVLEDTSGPEVPELGWTTNCGTWIAASGTTYGSLPLDEFIFNFDKDGNVISLENAALRQKYYKVGANGTSTLAVPQKLEDPIVPSNSSVLTLNKFTTPHTVISELR